MEGDRGDNDTIIIFCTIGIISYTVVTIAHNDPSDVLHNEDDHLYTS